MLPSQLIWVLAMAMVNTAAALPKLSNVERRSTLGTPKVAGWVSSWGGTKHVDLYDMYDEISFLPAVVNEKFEAVWSLDGDVTKSMPKEKMMSPQRPTLLSIGGWSGSGNFSEAVDEANRQTFIKSIVNLVTEWKFCGVDLDWEFPNGKPANASHVPGDKGNVCFGYSKEDSDNFLLFIRELRKSLKEAMGTQPILTAAVPFSGFIGKDGQPLEDASPYVASDTLDYISIMTYEMGHHYRHETGPHAPLYKNRKSPFDQQWSIEKSVEHWDSAGVPKSKIQIGIPAYGKIFNTTVAKGSDLKARPEYGGSLAYQPTNFLKMQDLLTKGEDLSALHAIDPTVAAAPDLQCPKAMRITVPEADGPTYALIVEGGYVGADGDSPGTKGWTYHWDEASATPFLYDKTTGRLLVYDSPRSVQAKSQWAKDNGLLGVKIFSVQGDTTDGTLLKAARAPWK